MDQHSSSIFIPSDYEIYVKPTDLMLTQRKLEGLKKLAEIKQWGIRNPTKFMHTFLGVDLLDAQEYVFMNSWYRPYCLWLESRGSGKALDLNTRIPTPEGDKIMKDIKIGDFVFDEKGEPTKVIGVSPIFYGHKCYKITFADGEEIVADAEHLWRVYESGHPRTKTTEELFSNYLYPPRKAHPNWKPECRYSVEICKPLQYSEKELPIHPYILGVWLGDGKADDGYITSSINDYEEMIKNIEDCGYIVSSVIRDSGDNKRLRVQNKDRKPLRVLLREQNFIQNKHIPDIYLQASVEQRLELLRGIMDTDGTINKNGNNSCEITQSIKHKTFLEDISKLLTSLGIKNVIKESIKTCQTGQFKALRISFYIPANLKCFKFKRKLDYITQRELSTYTKRKTIVKIEEVESRPVKCICVDSQSHLYLCGNKNTVTHNSTMIALYFMTKGMLFNNYWGYICSGNADQAQETFRKIEDIAKKNIESMTGLTDVFKNEIVINQANSDGFIRSPMGFTYKLYNGSFVKTLNSNIDGKRGKRGSAVCFDEGSWLTDEIFNVIGAFTAVNKDFKLGGNIDVNALPKEIPNQLIYASSASAMDTAFYKKYRDFSKKMFLGDDRYFVADINCDVVIHATAKGIPLSKSLLTQETVDNEMRNNPEKALREYYNRFTQDGGVNQIIKRSLITRNSEKYVPVLYNDTSKRKFVLCYDPARNIDNSTVLIAEIIFDEEHGYRLKIVNSVNFTDLNLKKKKKPMRTPDQIKALKQLILDYNGKQALDYDNITLLIDGGSGGGGHLIPDFFMEDWKDKSGKTHKGLIDPEYSSDYVKKYPTAVHKLKVIKPAELKSQMYEALIKMVESDLIIFPEQYDNHGYLVFTNKDDMKIQKIKDELYDEGLNDEEVEEKLFEMNLVQQETYKLSLDEENALSQIDAMKEEVVNICRVKRDGGKDAFRLPAHKDADTGASEGTMHKSCCALAA